MKKSSLLAVALILAGVTAALAFERFDIITTEDMKKMLDDRAAGHGDFILVNTLDEIIFRNAAIPGSVNLPWYRVNESANQLGDDKDKLVVTYCMGYR